MTKSKALKILNEYYQKNGNITLYYLYDWYEKELNFYKNLIGDTSLSTALSDFYWGVIKLDYIINPLKEGSASLTDNISPDLLIKNGYITYGKIVRALQMNTFKCNQYDEENCWLPLYVIESKKEHDEFYNSHIEKIKIRLQERLRSFNRITRKINPNI